jgi:hypothetical protein
MDHLIHAPAFRAVDILHGNRFDSPRISTAMDAPVVPLPTLDSLRNFVRHTLCDHDRIDPVEAGMRQALIRRHGRTCGLFFQIAGPRLLKTYAIWSSDDHRVLFYDSTGERIHEYRLSEEPELEQLDRAA